MNHGKDYGGMNRAVFYLDIHDPLFCLIVTKANVFNFS